MSPEQKRAAALAIGNEIRSERARRRVATESADRAEARAMQVTTLREYARTLDPGPLRTLTIAKWLAWIPRMGPARARILLVIPGCPRLASGALPFGRMTAHEARALADRIASRPW